MVQFNASWETQRDRRLSVPERISKKCRIFDVAEDARRRRSERAHKFPNTQIVGVYRLSRMSVEILSNPRMSLDRSQFPGKACICPRAKVSELLIRPSRKQSKISTQEPHGAAVRNHDEGLLSRRHRPCPRSPVIIFSHNAD